MPARLRGGDTGLFRTIVIGVVALVAVAGVLGAVFAVGLMRINLAERGPNAIASSQPASPVPAAGAQPPALASPDAAADPKPDPEPLISIEAIELPAENASLNGGLTLDKDQPAPSRPKKGRHAVGPPDPPPVVRQAIVGFKDEGQAAEWTVKLTKSGPYEIDVVYSCAGGRDRSVGYTVTVGDQELKDDASPRGGRENYQVATVGNGAFSAGEVKVRFRLSEPARGVLLRLRSVRLIPAN